MEHDQPRPDGPEHEAPPSIEALLATWGVVETEEAARLRPDAVAGLMEGDVQPALAYRREIEKLLRERPQGEPYQQTQIGILIAVAILRRDAALASENPDLLEKYLDDLWDARTLALNCDYPDIVDAIRTEAWRFDPPSDNL